jgi:hypothetical protein
MTPLYLETTQRKEADPPPTAKDDKLKGKGKGQRQKRKQIPFGDDNKKGKATTTGQNRDWCMPSRREQTTTKYRGPSLRSG